MCPDTQFLLKYNFFISALTFHEVNSSKLANQHVKTESHSNKYIYTHGNFNNLIPSYRHVS